MKIYYSHVSPYARKSIMLAKAGNLNDIDMVIANPRNNDEFRHLNPLGKIPFLVDGDEVFMDSSLICEYLNDTYVKPAGSCFYQKGNADYFHIQKQHTLANGIMDASVNIIMENRREDTQPSQSWIGRWQKAIDAALSELDTKYLGDSHSPNIASFAAIAALGYLDFRLPDVDWRGQHQTLADWHSQFTKLDWVVETIPQG